MGRQARERWNGALRLRSSTLSQPASGNSCSGAPQVAPALLTRMSSEPSREETSEASRMHSSWVETSAGRLTTAPKRAERLDGLVARLGLAGADVDPGARLQEAAGHHQADAPGPARDEGHLAVEAEQGHGSSPGSARRPGRSRSADPTDQRAPARSPSGSAVAGPDDAPPAPRQDRLARPAVAAGLYAAAAVVLMARVWRDPAYLTVAGRGAQVSYVVLLLVGKLHRGIDNKLGVPCRAFQHGGARLTARSPGFGGQSLLSRPLRPASLARRERSLSPPQLNSLVRPDCHKRPDPRHDHDVCHQGRRR